jgi:hypothetical protein
MGDQSNFTQSHIQIKHLLNHAAKYCPTPFFTPVALTAFHETS